MSVKINKLEIENVKRIKAVKLEPTTNGLTVIGGRNNQGKTSVLDSIAWALGGENFRPSDATREGSIIPPNLKIVLNNGLIVERKGKNSALKVTSKRSEGRTVVIEHFCRISGVESSEVHGELRKGKGTDAAADHRRW